MNNNEYNQNSYDADKVTRFANTISDMGSRLKANAEAIKNNGLSSETLKNILEISKYISTGLDLGTFDGLEYTEDSFLSEDASHFYNSSISSGKKLGGSSSDDFI